MVRVFDAAPADHECFSFLPAPSPLAMWTLRQASEIAIHRFDAEQARGINSTFDPTFASDMIDELLRGFAIRTGTIDMVEPKTMRVHAEDTGDDWFVHLAPDQTTTSLDGEHADLTLAGPAADLYVTLWNRAPTAAVPMQGDAALLDLWRANFRIRWS